MRPRSAQGGDARVTWLRRDESGLCDRHPGVGDGLLLERLPGTTGAHRSLGRRVGPRDCRVSPSRTAPSCAAAGAHGGAPLPVALGLSYTVDLSRENQFRSLAPLHFPLAIHSFFYTR